MNVIKLTLIIGAILGMIAIGAMPNMAATATIVVAPIVVTTITWDDDALTTDWHTATNWDPPQVPQPGDVVIIPTGSESLNIVVISSADAACKTLDIGDTSRLDITGKTLTLGLADNPTTSTLDSGGGEFADGTIRFVKDGGGNPGILKVHDTVTFDGGGTIDAPESTDLGIIERVGTGSPGGIVLVKDGTLNNRLIGNITLLCDVTNNATGRSGTDSGQTMVFGAPADNVDPEPKISGTGEFYSLGKVQFTIVTFGSSAPTWVVRTGEFEVTNDADDDHWVDVPFDVTFINKNGGLLDLKHNFSCTGTLSVAVSSVNNTQTIFVANGKIAEFKD